MPVVRILSDEVSQTSCNFSWDPPKNPNGEIKSYSIFIRFLNFSYFNPPQCAYSFEDVEEKVTADGENKYFFRHALPYATYSIQVQAQNGEEVSGYSKFETCTTLSGILSFKFLSVDSS